MSQTTSAERGSIEMQMIVEEGRRLKPLLSTEEWIEKRKELSQRAGVILHRELQKLNRENEA